VTRTTCVAARGPSQTTGVRAQRRPHVREHAVTPLSRTRPHLPRVARSWRRSLRSLRRFLLLLIVVGVGDVRFCRRQRVADGDGLAGDQNPVVPMRVMLIVRQQRRPLALGLLSALTTSVLKEACCGGMGRGLGIPQSAG
jgi:hypothetical protein